MTAMLWQSTSGGIYDSAASYVDGHADADPYYHCDLYDQRTDGKRLPQCIAATNPVIIESLRGKAVQYKGYSHNIEVRLALGLG